MKIIYQNVLKARKKNNLTANKNKYNKKYHTSSWSYLLRAPHPILSQFDSTTKIKRKRSNRDIGLFLTSIHNWFFLFYSSFVFIFFYKDTNKLQMSSKKERSNCRRLIFIQEGIDIFILFLIVESNFNRRPLQRKHKMIKNKSQSKDQLIWINYHWWLTWLID